MCSQIRWSVLLATLCSLIGCASNADKGASAAAPQPILARTQPPQQASSGVVAPPKDAQWTIYCIAVPGDNHVAAADHLKNDLLKTTPLKQWYVVHQATESVLYYGYYRSFKDAKDPKESARLRGDQQAIQQLADRLGNFPFREAMPVPIAAPDPAAPPEFNLENARGYWSLQIAAYQGSSERKKAAVDAVRDARARGIEAYYFHGPNVSSVCIGAWPEDAVRKQDSDAGRTIDPSQPVVVIGGMDPRAFDTVNRQAAGLRDRETGLPMKVMSQQVEVVDPTLKQAMRQYPTHVVNGVEEVVSYRDPKTGQLIDQPKPSMLVPIPHADTALARPAPPQQGQPNLLDPGNSDAQGLGRLRSVGQ